MKRALVACFLIACGGETDPIAVANPPVAPPAAAPPAPAPAPALTPAAPTQSAPTQTSSRMPNDIDDPSYGAYCAEKTNVPTRGSLQGDDYFWSEGAIDITGGVSDTSVSIHLRWPSTLTTDPHTGVKTRSDRYSYMTMAFEGELITGKATPARFIHGGGGYDCTAHSNQGGDAAGGSGDPSTLTITNRTDSLIEGALEVPTANGVQRMTFSAPIVPPAPTSTTWACCLKE